MTTSLLHEVLQAPQSQDVGFVFLKGGLLQNPKLLVNCIKRLQDWQLRHVILWACRDGLERATASKADWSAFHSLVEAVGKMKALTHLQIKQKKDEGVMIPVEWVTALLEQAGSRLERLELSNVRLVGSMEAHSKLVQAMETVRGLKSCHFDGVSLHHRDSSILPPDAVIKALVQLPRLVDVALESPALTDLQKPSETSCLGRIETLQLMLPADALNTVKFLSMAVLRSHQLSNLELVTVKPNAGHEANVAHEALQAPMMALAVAMASSTSLRTFKLTGDPLPSSVIDPFLVQLALELTRNPSSRLETLHVASNATSCRPCVGAALVDMLHFNYTLQDIKVYCHYQVNEGNVRSLDSTQRPEIEFFLGLNRSGRKQLLQQVKDRDKWINLLEGQSMDIIHYYLRANPWLCQQGTDSASHGSADDRIGTSPHSLAEQAKKHYHLRERRALEMENQLLREELASIRNKRTSLRKGRSIRLLRRFLWRK